MDDRFQYANVRQQIIDALKIDLLGPQSENEVLDENPRHAYVTGFLAPKGNDNESGNVDMVMDIAPEDNNDVGVEGQDDDNEPVTTISFIPPSSIGISFYVSSLTRNIKIAVSWGDYTKSVSKEQGRDGKEYDKAFYTRQLMSEVLPVDLESNGRTKEYRLKVDSNVAVHVSKIAAKGGYSFVTAYVINRRTNAESDCDAMMFQVEIKAESSDGNKIFLSERLCRSITAPDEFYFEHRPIFGRGRGCAVAWGDVCDGKTNFVKSNFIPEYELPGVSPALEKLPLNYFSMMLMGHKGRKDEIISRLNILADMYEDWIKGTLEQNPQMRTAEFKGKIGDSVIAKCRTSLGRIREGIETINQNNNTFEAFCFMNRCMLMQRGINRFAKNHGSGVECGFLDYIDPKNPENEFAWRPFQIAFVLMNLSAIVNPLHQDREVVDLLYFPTGGGKTEAYLGLMAFTIANRRLNAKKDEEYNRDGGVTAILRYTLRLLTTQQRDRITRMVVAAEMIRAKEPDKFGSTPISIGFWVGGGVTPNKFSNFVESPEFPGESRHQKNLLFKQLLICPFCGKPLSEENFNIDIDRKKVEIFCSDKNCYFSKYRSPQVAIPVYLVDEEIYGRCPTIILATVDKFASLPWKVETNSLFGRVNRYNDRDGFVALGADHRERYNKKGDLSTAETIQVKPFLPPELIIQDELHLITGPLGTIYGAYETIIEDMCSFVMNGKKVKPKYVVSTATIKNADAQTKCLYARSKSAQFPPNGFDIGDSFFVREISIQDHPFRKYIGICAPSQSMKTVLLRTYAIILQKTEDLLNDDTQKTFVDPYYTLVGYYNSIRELGGAVRLIQDDIPKRIQRLVRKYNLKKMRYLNKNNNAEITSRIPSFKIPEQLRKLETPCTEADCLDTAIATSMIGVGMDVDRLGLMTVTGQPKQNSEYIQATSRIGRSFPGLVVTLYNPYRPRDLSHYENFSGYHAQLYRFVEGTTATPFSARARDRVLHALVIAAIRLKFPQFAPNDRAERIKDLSADQMSEIKKIILDRLGIVKPQARNDAEMEIEEFIDNWKTFTGGSRQLRYYVPTIDRYNRLMNYYNEPCSDQEMPTLNSMREVESGANMFYFLED